MKKEIDMPSRSRDRILSLISVLEYLRKEGKICDEKGIEMTGSYWDGIKKDIASKCHGNLSRGGMTLINPMGFFPFSLWAKRIHI